jgi:hypothetical protein
MRRRRLTAKQVAEYAKAVHDMGFAVSRLELEPPGALLGMDLTNNGGVEAISLPTDGEPNEIDIMLAKRKTQRNEAT